MSECLHAVETHCVIRDNQHMIAPTKDWQLEGVCTKIGRPRRRRPGLIAVGVSSASIISGTNQTDAER